MRSAQISFLNKRILIIGGGKQALKKGQQFKDDGAMVKYIAPNFINEIEKRECFIKTYEKSDLQGAFLVYACTDDKVLNHQIILDANAMGILSGNVNRDIEATYHPLQCKDYPHLHVAISTNGSYPSYIDEIFMEIEENYYEVHHEILEKLQFIRSYVVKLSLTHDEKRSLLKRIGKASASQIHFYEQAIKKQKALIAIFHGNHDSDSLTLIESFLKNIESKVYPLYYAFLKADEKNVFSLDEINQHMRMLEIKQVVYQPMLNETGHCYQSILDKLGHQNVEGLLINEINIDELICEYAKCEQGVLVVHDSKKGQFYDLLKRHCPSHLHVMMLNELISELDASKPVTLSGVFMLAGKHMQIDVHGSEGVASILIKAGYRVICHYDCLLQMTSFQKIFKEKVKCLSNKR